LANRRSKPPRGRLAEKGDDALFKQVALTALDEKLCVQALHTGPYGREPETVARMEALAARQGYRLEGWCHEIYLSDPRRVAPEKLRTILRIPVAPAGASKSGA
jgi:hypothetical protein